ncbi:NAD-dependent epimerase/dehydratase family protein [Clostridium felsineum]|uniref:NAD-dependent epimerase/dehydratase family protein n=1 Tax=Clostridium felsineum TaxID=36839 RepID=UPI00214D2B98|nr:NAD-dependent epimerase/dehydratase family protein [Clostridium felsineum]MCR3759426.1 NAD-dependent epimerase/dehydratase family protein [Clostridium felsineum]
MRILIVGGCGFIGSYVADRLYKEGHKIYIIDNLLTGSMENVKVPHKFYDLSVESKRCEEIFKSNKFEAVIDLSSQIDINSFAKKDSNQAISTFPGVVNLLELSRKYGVKRFIFASSAAVYGDSNKIPTSEDEELKPLSVYAINKYVGEYYCQKWFDLYGLKTICLRFSNVFGPRQNVKGESSVVANFITKTLKDEEIDVFGDGTQTRDFIYVEDAVDAIYRALKSEHTGVFNISTNTEHSINELINIIEEIQPIKKINNKSNRSGDVEKSSLNNSKAKTQLGFNVKYSFKEGIQKTYKWYKENYSFDESVNYTTKNEEYDKKNLFFKALPYIENIIFMLVIALLVLDIFKISDPYSSSFAQLCYIYIIVMAIMYGMRQAGIAIIFSCALYFYLLINSGYSAVTILYDPLNLPQVISYIIIGLVSGYVSEVYKRKLYMNKLEIDKLNEKYKFLELIYNETVDIKEELQEQIISSENSFVNIYNTTKTLDSLEVNDIYFGAIKIIDKLLDTSKSSIYILNRDSKYLRLKAKSSNVDLRLPYSINLNETQEIKKAIDSKKIFVNKDLKPKLPTMAAPVIINDNVKAVISIYDVKFEKLNLYYENLFKVLVDLISNAIGKALKYDEVASKDKYIPNTEILISKEFKKVLADKNRDLKTSDINFTLLKISKNNLSYEDIFNKLSVNIRDNDSVGIGEDNCVYVILSNTDKAKSQKVLGRIAASGLNAEVMEDLS